MTPPPRCLNQRIPDVSMIWRQQPVKKIWIELSHVTCSAYGKEVGRQASCNARFFISSTHEHQFLFFFFFIRKIRCLFLSILAQIWLIDLLFTFFFLFLFYFEKPSILCPVEICIIGLRGYCDVKSRTREFRTLHWHLWQIFFELWLKIIVRSAGRSLSVSLFNETEVCIGRSLSVSFLKGYNDVDHFSLSET